MIRKESSDGIGYSVVELDDIRHVFASARPRQGDTLQEQTHDALKTIEAVIEEEGTLGSIVTQAVFLKDINQLETCRQIMKEFYGDELPATTYIPQPPCDGKLIEVEAWGVGQGLGEVEIERHSERMVVARHNGVDWIHLAHIFPETTAAGVYDRSRNIFELTARGLESQKFRYDQVIRTWLYLGDIVGPEGDTQRYKELNRARTDFYKDIRFGGSHIPPGMNGSVSTVSFTRAPSMVVAAGSTICNSGPGFGNSIVSGGPGVTVESAKSLVRKVMLSPETCTIR